MRPYEDDVLYLTFNEPLGIAQKDTDPKLRMKSQDCFEF
jgi:hypothetical protein